MAPPRRGVCNWTFVGPRNVGGRATAISVDPTDPNRVFLGTAGGGVWRSADAGKSWEPLFDNEFSLSIGALAVAPSNRNRLYVGTGEVNGNYDEVPGTGVYRSDDGGGGWRRIATPTETSSRISAILVHPTNPDWVLVASPGDNRGRAGIWRTETGGRAWTVATLLPQGIPIQDAVWDLAGRFDGGSENVVYCGRSGVSNLVRRSDDFGATWRELSPGLSTPGVPQFWADRVAVAIADSSPQRIYARAPLQRGSGTMAEFRGVVWRSNDGGRNWTGPIDDGAGYLGGFANALAVKGDDANVVYGGSYWVARSEDGGGRFTPAPGGTGAGWGEERYTGPVDLHPDIHALTFAPRARPTRVYCAGDGGFYVSHFGEPGQIDGAHWVKRNHGLNVTQFSHVGIAQSTPSMFGGGTQDNGTPRRVNGLTWRIVYGGDGGIFEVNRRDASECYYQALTGDLRRSIDGGRTEMSFRRGLDTVSEDTGWLEVPFAFDPSDPATKYTGTSRVYRSVGTGDWSSVSDVLTEMPGDMQWNPLLALEVDPGNRNVLWAGAINGRLFRASSPSSAGWQERTGGWPRQPISAIRVHPSNSNEVYVVVNGWRTDQRVYFGDGTAGGWRDISSTLVACSVGELVIDPWDPARQTLYLATDVGLFRTANRGATWTLLDAGMPNSPVWGLSLNQEAGLLRAATHGRGMWELEVGPAARCRDFQLYVRSSPLDMGRGVTPSNVPDPVRPRERVYWWESPDLKVDAEPFQTWRHVTASGRTEEVTKLDGVVFDAELVHNFPRRGRVSRVYAQVHNRGPFPVTNARVRLFTTDATGALPNVPDGFWSGFVNWRGRAGAWTPIGPAQNIPELRPAVPEVQMFEWTVPPDQAEHSCILMLVTCDQDPIAAEGPRVDLVVPSSRHVALRNVHVVDFGVVGSPSDTDPALLTSDRAPAPRIVELVLYNPLDEQAEFTLMLERDEIAHTTAGVILPRGMAAEIGVDPDKHAFDLAALWEAERVAVEQAWEESSGGKYKSQFAGTGSFKRAIRRRKKFFDDLDEHLWISAKKARTVIDGITISPAEPLRVAVVAGPTEGAKLGLDQHLRLIQFHKGQIVGGSTIELRTGPERVAGRGHRSLSVVLERLNFAPQAAPFRFHVEALVGRQRGHQRVRLFVPPYKEEQALFKEGALEEISLFEAAVEEEGGLDLRIQPVLSLEDGPEVLTSEDQHDPAGRAFKDLGRLILPGPITAWARQQSYEIHGSSWDGVVRVETT